MPTFEIGDIVFYYNREGEEPSFWFLVVAEPVHPATCWTVLYLKSPWVEQDAIDSFEYKWYRGLGSRFDIVSSL